MSATRPGGADEHRVTLPDVARGDRPGGRHRQRADGSAELAAIPPSAPTYPGHRHDSRTAQSDSAPRRPGDDAPG